MTMLLELAISATILLSLAWALLVLSRRLGAAAKHRLCVTALALVVLLPAIGLLPLARPAVLANIALTGVSVPGESEASGWWLMALWAAGAAFILLRFAVGIGYLAALTRRASKQVNGLAPAHVEVRYSDVNTPLVWGWVRPTILLPKSFPEWTAATQKAALDHELAHVSGRDSWIALVVAAAQAMYWFHPLAWWLSKKLVELREFAADDQVLIAGTDAVTYADLLLNFAQSSRPSRLLGCAMMAGALRTRVERLLKPQTCSRRWPSAIASGCSILLLLSCALLAPARGRLADEVYKIGGSVTAPRLLQKTEPQYSEKSRSEKKQGTVLLGAIVGKEGKPRSLEVLRSLSPDLDKKAMEAVSSWLFEPAMKDGKPVAVRVQIEIHFQLL